MTPTQFYISVAVVPVTTIIIVLVGILLNNTNMNARLSDLNTRFADRFDDLKELIRANADRQDALAERQDANLRRVEEELLGKFAELDNRLSRIEHHLNLG